MQNRKKVVDVCYEGGTPQKSITSVKVESKAPLTDAKFARQRTQSLDNSEVAFD